jgi:hypothetical protein
MKNESKNLAKIIPFPTLLAPAPTYFSGLGFYDLGNNINLDQLKSDSTYISFNFVLLKIEFI